MIAKILGIRIFDVEVSSRCNLHCRFCPREELPETGLMSEETFERFLEQVPLRGTDNLAFVGMGEPTLNPRLPDFIRRAKARYPKVITWVTSNGTRLTEDVVRSLIDAGLDILDVSFNGLDRESYESEMRGARYEQTLSNIAEAATFIRRAKARTRLQINYIVSQETSGRESEIQAFWRRHGVTDFRRQRAHDRAGLARTEGMTPLGGAGLNGRPCRLFDVSTFVTWRGDILCCPHDMARAHKIGNVETDSRKTIERRKKAIRRHAQWPAMCRHCTDPLRFDIRQQIDEKIGEEFVRRLRHAQRAIRRWNPVLPREPEEESVPV